jgi:membrane protein
LVIGILIFIIIPDAISVLINKLHIEFILDIKFSNLRYFALFLLILFSNTLLYFGLPNCKQEITQTIPGSILVGFLTIILIKLFLFYIANFQQFNLVYGSLAGIIAILMFFYFLALIFIFGAEFNYHFHRVYKIYLKKKVK